MNIKSNINKIKECNITIKINTRYTVLTLCVFIIMCFSGCENKLEYKVIEECTISSDERQEIIVEEVVKIANYYKDEYITAKKENKIAESIQNYIDALEKEDIVAIDYNNEYNMCNYNKVITFNEKVENKEEAELSIVRLSENGGFARYDFSTQDGDVNIIKTNANWIEDNYIEITFMDDFTSIYWEYTDKGYLFFEKYIPHGYDGPSGSVGIRVLPLEQKLRDMCKQYISFITYDGINMFLCDWNESDYSGLDFLDVFEVLYEHDNNVNLLDKDAPNGIKSDVFEGTIMKYMNVSSEQLKSIKSYDAQTDCYMWRERTYDELPFMYTPCSEVVDYRENEDGSLTLVVDAVWYDENTDKAITHEVTVMPKEDGGFKYIANEFFENEKNINPIYIDRIE